MRSLFAIALCAICLLTTGAYRAAPIMLLRIAVLGDSIAQGWGTANAPTDAFPHRLHVPGTVLGVATFAHGGYTVAQMMPAIPALLATHPDVVIIELGTNDQRWYHPLAQFRADYAALLTALRSVHRHLCLGIWPSPGHTDTAPYDAVIQQMCGATGYINISELAIPRYTNAANWHPNTAGALAIAERVSCAIRPCHAWHR